MVAATARLCSTTLALGRSNSVDKVNAGSSRFSIGFTNHIKTTSYIRFVRVRASNPPIKEANSSTKDAGRTVTSPEGDLKYLVKLGVGSVFGAALIKYGSIIWPEITRPNIFQALVMVSAPVVVAVVLLVKHSRAQ